VNDDRDDADDQIDVAGALQHLNQLRADFRAANRADGHDQSQLKIDIAKRPMLSHGHHRFADNVGEIGADREVPIQSDRAQSRPGNETAAYPKKAAENADYESDDDKINRADVRTGDWKKHSLFRAPTNQSQQKCGYILKKNRLADHEQNGGTGVSVTVASLELVQAFSQKMQHQKKICDHENGINDELNQECA